MRIHKYVEFVHICITFQKILHASVGTVYPTGLYCAMKVCNYNYRGKAAIHFTGVVCRKC